MSSSFRSHSVQFTGLVPAELRSAVAARLPSVYAELRQQAERCLGQLPPGQSICPTDLVHETFLKMDRGAREADWRSDEHFVATAAIAMRQVAVDRIRKRIALKRGGGAAKIPIEEMVEDSAPGGERLTLLVDHVLEDLEAESSRLAWLVHLRFYLGLTDAEVAEAMRVSERTVRRDWLLVKAWLLRAFEREGLSGYLGRGL